MIRKGFKTITMLVMAICLAMAIAPEVMAKPKAKPASVSISAKRAAIMSYLASLPAKSQTLSGVQVNEYEVYLKCTSFDRVEQLTKKTPAIMGTELMFAMEYPPYEKYLTAAILRQASTGGLVTMAWHWRNPLEVCLRGEIYECTKTPMSEADLKLMLTPGTHENALMNADIDRIAPVLKRLEAKGIVILWRPLHEMNGGWFWWGQKTQYPALWDALYERLVIHNGVKNLIWVWGPDKASNGGPPAATYAAMEHKPDIIGADIYADSSESPEFTNAAIAYRGLIPDRLFAYSEVGIPPSPEIVATQKPIWILLWGEEFLDKAFSKDGNCKSCNTPETVAAFFKRPEIVTLDAVPADVRKTLRSGIIYAAKPRATCPARFR